MHGTCFEFDLGIDYEVLMKIHNHLSREHGLPDSCEVMRELGMLWGIGCDNRVARNPDDVNDKYVTYKKVVRKK
jgi:hypothetical protein